MALRFFNTMGRKIEEFTPIREGFVGFYGCGPTVYNFAHIGNLRAYVFQDILDRTLTFLGFDKTHVMNITDIGHLTGDDDSGEDKMLKTAHERHQSVLEVADFYTQAFFHDTDQLNILRPDVVCRATEHVGDMIDLIKRIEANGHTYVAGGNLYYDVSTYPEYGKLAALKMDELRAGARIEVDANKRNPCDFALWFTKSKFENQALVWDSPWGRGYPGWHIECSAMSMKYLGEHFDIHTGGIDHVPIHHTNEIAQSEGATGKKWVNYWLHNEFLVVAKDKQAEGGVDDPQKMSKSAGNFLTLQALVDMGFEPLDYRFFLLGAHYRKQVYFSREAMESAKKARAALVQRVAKLLGFCDQSCAQEHRLKAYAKGEVSRTEGLSTEAQSHLQKFREALENDLSTPHGLSVLQAVVKDSSLAPNEALELVCRMDSVLGLKLIQSARALLDQQSAANITATQGGAQDAETQQIEQLLSQRNQAKKARDFARADAIRDELSRRGIQVTDTPTGTVWKRL